MSYFGRGRPLRTSFSRGGSSSRNALTIGKDFLLVAEELSNGSDIYRAISFDPSNAMHKKTTNHTIERALLLAERFPEEYDGEGRWFELVKTFGEDDLYCQAADVLPTRKPLFKTLWGHYPIQIKIPIVLVPDLSDLGVSSVQRRENHFYSPIIGHGTFDGRVENYGYLRAGYVYYAFVSLNSLRPGISRKSGDFCVDSEPVEWTLQTIEDIEEPDRPRENALHNWAECRGIVVQVKGIFAVIFNASSQEVAIALEEGANTSIGGAVRYWPIEIHSSPTNSTKQLIMAANCEPISDEAPAFNVKSIKNSDNEFEACFKFTTEMSIWRRIELPSIYSHVKDPENKLRVSHPNPDELVGQDVRAHLRSELDFVAHTDEQTFEVLGRIKWTVVNIVIESNAPPPAAGISAIGESSGSGQASTSRENLLKRLANYKYSVYRNTDSPAEKKTPDQLDQPSQSLPAPLVTPSQSDENKPGTSTTIQQVVATDEEPKSNQSIPLNKPLASEQASQSASNSVKVTESSSDAEHFPSEAVGVVCRREDGCCFIYASSLPFEVKVPDTCGIGSNYWRLGYWIHFRYSLEDRKGTHLLKLDCNTIKRIHVNCRQFMTAPCNGVLAVRCPIRIPLDFCTNFCPVRVEVPLIVPIFPSGCHFDPKIFNDKSLDMLGGVYLASINYVPPGQHTSNSDKLDGGLNSQFFATSSPGHWTIDYMYTAQHSAMLMSPSSVAPPSNST